MQFKSLFFVFSLFAAVFANSYILYFEQGPLTPNKYVTIVKDKIIALGGEITHDFSTVLTGFTFNILDTGLVEAISKFSDERYPFFIEKDTVVTIDPNEMQAS